jgi:D-tagatose-1,6-bisphosphate aldolase subunit GatZ/KbaZ
MHHACELVRACVLAGYKKIHLDASMACADDSKGGPDERTITQRAALLCRAAETTFEALPPGSCPLLYVIGTEVPAPGGESLSGVAPAVSPADQIDHTLDLFRDAFAEQNVTSAWDRVIGMVVQPGVEFGDNVIFDYDREKAMALSSALPEHPALVYEAHSTDYQKPAALAEMVEDHFAILKVGPWLTFAFREAVFALSAIEREWLGHRNGVRLSQVRESLDAAMLRNPKYWRSYYHGTEDEMRLSRIYSYSDRCRYYWGDATVQQELARLRANLGASAPPLTLVSQFLPLQYAAIRLGGRPANVEDIIQEHIRTVLRVYAGACGVKRAP